MKTCQFADMQNDILRDRIVVGIREDGLRKQLLQKKDLSFRKCIDTCCAYDSTSAQMRDENEGCLCTLFWSSQEDASTPPEKRDKQS